MAFGRAETLFRSQQQEVYREIDRLFVWLLLLEWAVAVVVALLVSPASWRGAHFHVGLHVWAALLFGGTITLEFLPAIPPGIPRKAFMAELERRLEGASARLAEAP